MRRRRVRVAYPPAVSAAPRLLVPHPARGLVLALGASVLFAINGTMSKLVLEAGVSPLHLVELRSIGAAACLMALVSVIRREALAVTRRELAFLALYGVTGIGLVQWLYFVAIARLPVAVALLLEYLAPLLVALWVRFVRGEPVRPRIWVALVLSLAGLSLVTRISGAVELDGLGILAGLGAAVSLAAYFLLGERALTGRDPLSLAAWSFLFAGILWSIVRPWWTLPFPLLGSSTALDAPVAATVPVWVLIGLVIVAGTVVPYLLVLGAIRDLGATRVGLVGMAEPVGAGLVAWVVLGEVLDRVQLAGAVIVLAGIALAETSRRRRDEATAPLPEGMAP